jgi:hypothetical protein
MKAFLIGVAAMVVISGGAALYYATIADLSAAQRFTSEGAVRLDVAPRP